MKKLLLAASVLLTLLSAGLASATDTATPAVAAAEPAASAPVAEAPASVPDATASAPTDGATAAAPAKPFMDIPAGAMARTDEISVAYFARAKANVPGDIAIYRPSVNMPEASMDFLRDQVTGKPTTGFLGYLPRLKIYPCADDCKGSDYDRILKSFLRGYESYTRGDGKVEWRGEMPVEVRWFHMKTMFVPLSSSQFGISFVYEGKLVSLGKSTSTSSATSIFSHAEALGERMAYDLLMRAGAGLRPRFMTHLDSESGLTKVNEVVGSANVAIRALAGGVDARSRIEPLDPGKHARLLPAFDGIAPGEVRPIKEMLWLPDL